MLVLRTKTFLEVQVPQKKTVPRIARLTQNPWIMAGLSLILGLAVSWRVGLLEKIEHHIGVNTPSCDRTRWAPTRGTLPFLLQK